MNLNDTSTSEKCVELRLYKDHLAVTFPGESGKWFRVDPPTNEEADTLRAAFALLITTLPPGRNYYGVRISTETTEGQEKADTAVNFTKACFGGWLPMFCGGGIVSTLTTDTAPDTQPQSASGSAYDGGNAAPAPDADLADADKATYVGFPVTTEGAPDESRMVRMNINVDEIEILFPSVPGRVWTFRPSDPDRLAALRRTFESKAITHADGTRSMRMAFATPDGIPEYNVGKAAVALALSGQFADAAAFDGSPYSFRMDDKGVAVPEEDQTAADGGPSQAN